MATTMTPSEETQLGQTIEMFEVITQSQPQDYQSLEILKEAYSKLGRDSEAVATSKRIAQAYVQMGQLSSAILEYETILQRFPDDPDVKTALQQIESKASNFATESTVTAAEPAALAKPVAPTSTRTARPQGTPSDVEDGQRVMRKVFVDARHITAGDFDLCWTKHDLSEPPNGIIEPFIQMLSDKGIMPIEKSLRILSEHSRVAYLTLNTYEIDLDLARGFPAATCQRWCLLPFDRMSKSILVATANPYNQQAAKELAEATNNRLLWYLVTPTELVKNLRKVFR